MKVGLFLSTKIMIGQYLNFELRTSNSEHPQGCSLSIFHSFPFREKSILS